MLLYCKQSGVLHNMHNVQGIHHGTRILLSHNVNDCTIFIRSAGIYTLLVQYAARLYRYSVTLNINALVISSYP